MSIASYATSFVMFALAAFLDLEHMQMALTGILSQRPLRAGIRASPFFVQISLQGSTLIGAF